MIFAQCVFVLFTALYPPQYKAVKMQFKPVFKNETLILNEKQYVAAQSDTLSVSTFRFYLSNIQYIFEDGSAFSEPNSVHLLDVEKEESLVFEVKGVPNQKLQSVNFNIGVDSLTNVAGALTGDLDPIQGMYWAWNTGYINAKIEGKSKSCHTPKNVFEFHIGGYLSPFNTLRKIQLTPKNRISDNGKITIEVDASKWFSNIKLAETNSVLLPNKTAMTIADNYHQMFKIVETDGK